MLRFVQECHARNVWWGGGFKMSKKACEIGINHKMAFAIDLLLKIGKMGISKN